MLEASCFLSPLPPLPRLPSRLGVHLPSRNEKHHGVAARSLHDHHDGDHRNLHLSSATPSVRRCRPRDGEVGPGEPEKEDVLVLPQEEERRTSGRRRRGNWVTKILRITAIWEREKEESAGDGGGEEEVERMLEMGDKCVGCCDGEEGCDVGGGHEVEFDRDSFSRFLRRASLAEAKSYSKLSYLGILAYSIPKIQTGNLLKEHGLHFVTSSLEKKSEGSTIERKRPIDQNQLSKTSKASKPVSEKPFDKNQSSSDKNSNVTKDQAVMQHQPTDSKTQIHSRRPISVSGTYRIVASAASYLQSQSKSILPFGQRKLGSSENDGVGDKTIRDGDIRKSEEASFVVTTDSVTAVVAGKEEMKEAFSKELKHSSPCKWFVCDDESGGTRFFVIQGSESLASWQANLLFEPVQFEDMGVFVHRGIYEAAKGIYEQMLPEVRSHLRSRGETATLCFTGHSLGGSLSLLVNLMLLIRGEAPASSLLPVVTFGAPSIMCGGNHLLRKVGLPLGHVQAITMHRDIVPRAFSCTYPDRVKEILMAVNGNFRSHSCLVRQNLLYSPMGEILILQPDEKQSPNHHLLPSGGGLYFLTHPSDSYSRRLTYSALSAFLNSPHPLEILSNRAAYGSSGAVNRNHDMISYLRSMQYVIAVERRRIKKSRKEWLANDAGGSLPLLGLFQGGSGSLKRIARIITSRKLHGVVLLILPVRGLLLEAWTASL